MGYWCDCGPGPCVHTRTRYPGYGLGKVLQVLLTMTVAVMVILNGLGIIK